MKHDTTIFLYISSTFLAQFLSKKYFGCPLLNFKTINNLFEHLMFVVFRESLMGAISRKAEVQTSFNKRFFLFPGNRKAKQ